MRNLLPKRAALARLLLSQQTRCFFLAASLQTCGCGGIVDQADHEEAKLRRGTVTVSLPTGTSLLRHDDLAGRHGAPRLNAVEVDAGWQIGRPEP